MSKYKYCARCGYPEVRPGGLETCRVCSDPVCRNCLYRVHDDMTDFEIDRYCLRCFYQSHDVLRELENGC